MLVGDAEGTVDHPTQVPSYGTSSASQYRLRIPQNLVGTPYKLIFVANGMAYDHREGDPVYLNFDGVQTKIMGILEPINL
jgi:hypothetical protein